MTQTVTNWNGTNGLSDWSDDSYYIPLWVENIYSLWRERNKVRMHGPGNAHLSQCVW